MFGTECIQLDIHVLRISIRILNGRREPAIRYLVAKPAARYWWDPGVATFIRKVSELSVQEVNGSPISTYWMVNCPPSRVGSVGTLPAVPGPSTFR